MTVARKLHLSKVKVSFFHLSQGSGEFYLASFIANCAKLGQRGQTKLLERGGA